MNNQINLEGLLPNFSSINTFPPQTPEQISAIFVIALITISITFLLISIIHLIKSTKQVKWINNLLKGMSTQSIAQNRQELIEKANIQNQQGAHLWLEFDESLIEVTNENRTQLYNTIDASHFFNSSSLAAGITESRMLAAVPGFLTAVGVIGTFVGLQLGLSELNIGNDVAVSEMKSGLAHVISGAEIAFMTSVWGVFLSVIFNFIEKLIENSVRKKIHKLQIRIDKLFPRLSAESQLQNIVNSSQESRESLQGLAEQIGEKMQESMLDVQKGIQTGLEESLQKIMSPAIDKLVEVTSSGSEKALESLVEKFLSSFGQLGEAQRLAMDKSTENVGQVLQGLQKTMNSFLISMNNSQNKTAEREKDLINTISSQVSQIVDYNVEQKQLLTKFVSEQLTGISKEFEASHQKSLVQDEKRQNLFIEQTSKMNKSTESLLDRIDKGLEAQFASSEAIIKQGEKLQASITESITANNNASSSLKTSANELNLASQEMKGFGLHIQQAGDNLSGAVTEAVESTANLAQQNQSTSELIIKQREQLIRNRQQMNEAVNKLELLIQSADTTFDKMQGHQNNFLDDLKNNVSSLSNQMTELLSDYSEQANAQTAEHLGIWAKHTSNYADKMNMAAKALSTVIDEIEEKVVA